MKSASIPPEHPAHGATLASTLRTHRLRAGLSQEELAERSGLSADAISALERGVRRRAQPRTLRALEAVMDFELRDGASDGASG